MRQYHPLLTVHNAVSGRPVHACDIVCIYAQENDRMKSTEVQNPRRDFQT